MWSYFGEQYKIYIWEKNIYTIFLVGMTIGKKKHATRRYPPVMDGLVHETSPMAQVLVKISTLWWVSGGSLILY